MLDMCLWRISQWNDWNFDIQWSELDANNQLIPGKVVVKHNGKEVANVSGLIITIKSGRLISKWAFTVQVGVKGH